MKIGLVTSEESFLNNYGAVLQGYALSTVLKNMGHKVKIVRYRGSSPDIRHRIRKRCSRILRTFVKTPLMKERERLYAPYKSDLNEITKRMQAFEDEYLEFYNNKRLEWPKLKSKKFDADAFVCGSDQIWNPNYKQGFNDPGYFLDFVPEDKKRIAYSPSFGCDDIPKTAQKDIKYYLDKFSFISVREPEGAKIIKKYADKDVSVLADPTFLLLADEWKKIQRTPKGIPSKYILCYRFMKNDNMTDAMDYLSNEMGLPIVTIPLSATALKDDYIKEFRVGPKEFVGLIANAELVCTDSFHATAFSLITNTPFYTFLDTDAEKKGTNMNSRIRKIIELAQLENRVLDSKDNIDIKSVTEVDFSVFNENVKRFREDSLEALTKALM